MSTDSTIIAAVIGGIFVLIAAIIGGVFAIVAAKIGSKKKGKLKVSEIIIKPNTRWNFCLLDFRVHNLGDTDIIINKITSRVLDFARSLTKGALDFSKTYDLDISNLTKRNSQAELTISQLVQAGKIDRFAVKLIARNLGMGVFGGWLLNLTLHTNNGQVNLKPIEIWLPHRLNNQTRFEMHIGALKMWVYVHHPKIYFFYLTRIYMPLWLHVNIYDIADSRDKKRKKKK